MRLDDLLEILHEIQRINQAAYGGTAVNPAVTQIVKDGIATARKRERSKLADADADARRTRNEDPLVWVDDDGTNH